MLGHVRAIHGGESFSELIKLAGGIMARAPFFSPQIVLLLRPPISTCFFSHFSTASTTRLKLTLAVKLLVANGCGLVMTKLNVVSLFGSKAGRSFVPPMTHLADWPIILPWSSSRKQTARADSILSARPFFIFNSTNAFWSAIFGGETVTASCAGAVKAQNSVRQNVIWQRWFMVTVTGNFTVWMLLAGAHQSQNGSAKNDQTKANDCNWNFHVSVCRPAAQVYKRRCSVD